MWCHPLNCGSHLTLRHDSDLRKTTVHKNFRPGDIATLIRCEKHHSPSNFIRSAKPAKWDCAGDHLAPLLTCFVRCEQIIQAGRVDGARADRINSNSALLEICGPGLAKERMDAFVALYTSCRPSSAQYTSCSALSRLGNRRSTGSKSWSLWIGRLESRFQIGVRRRWSQAPG